MGKNQHFRKLFYSMLTKSKCLLLLCAFVAGEWEGMMEKWVLWWVRLYPGSNSRTASHFIVYTKLHQVSHHFLRKKKKRKSYIIFISFFYHNLGLIKHVAAKYPWNVRQNHFHTFILFGNSKYFPTNCLNMKIVW